MILYSKRYGGAPLIFRLTGTSWPYGIVPAMISCSVSMVLGWIPSIDEIIRDKDLFMGHPYPFQLYVFIVGFLIVFRTNFAYQRYWEGRGTIAHMSGKWLDGACMAVVFDATGNESTPYLDGIGSSNEERNMVTQRQTENGCPSHEEFFEEIAHLFSLMHALALQHLREDADLENLCSFGLEQLAQASRSGSTIEGNSRKARLSCLPEAPLHSDHHETLSRPRAGSGFTVLHGGARKEWIHQVYKHQQLYVIGDITDAERRVLDRDRRGTPIPTEARVTMLESWIMRRLLARQKHEKSDMGQTSPPNLSRLYQVISDGHIGFGQASKIMDTPFPFPYQNIIQVFLWLYVFTVPVVMNAWLKDDTLRFALTFLSVWCYFALNQVGQNLEDPYIPYDPNELALTHIQHSFNAKLLSFGIVPDTEELVARPTINSDYSKGHGNGIHGTSSDEDASTAALERKRLVLEPEAEAVGAPLLITHVEKADVVEPQEEVSSPHGAKAMSLDIPSGNSSASTIAPSGGPRPIGSSREHDATHVRPEHDGGSPGSTTRGWWPVTPTQAASSPMPGTPASATSDGRAHRDRSGTGLRHLGSVAGCCSVGPHAVRP